MAFPIIIKDGKTYSQCPTGSYQHTEIILCLITDMTDSHIQINDEFVIPREKIKADLRVRHIWNENIPMVDAELQRIYNDKGCLLFFSEPILLEYSGGEFLHVPQGSGINVITSTGEQYFQEQGQWIKKV